MAGASTGERTLMPAIIPPGAAHINGILSLAILQESPHELVHAAAVASSLISDFIVRAVPKLTFGTPQ